MGVRQSFHLRSFRKRMSAEQQRCCRKDTNGEKGLLSVSGMRRFLLLCLLLPRYTSCSGATRVFIWDSELHALPAAGRNSATALRFKHNYARECAYFAGLSLPPFASDLSGDTHTYDTTFCREDCHFIGGSPDEAPEAHVLVAYAQAIFWRIVHHNFSVTAALEPVRHHAASFKVLYWREAASFTPLRRRLDIFPALLVHFDILMGVHLYADILNPDLFPWPSDVHDALEAPLQPFEERPGLILHVSSHCDAEPRRAYIAELSKHLPIDIFGACGRREPAGGIAQLAPKYKFLLAFENTISRGYVTEKLLINPIKYSIVPIYLGAPDLAHVLPSIVPGHTGHHPTPKFQWYIDAADFDSPKALAKYIRNINETQWAAYMAYRPTLTDNLRTSRFPWIYPTAASHILDATDPTLPRRLISNLSAVLDTFVFGGYGARGVNTKEKLLSRRAAACRLCDLNFLSRAAKSSVRRRFGDNQQTVPTLSQVPIRNLSACFVRPECSVRKLLM